eukprot:13431127-Alexandrium_andersonii.AAC.1
MRSTCTWFEQSRRAGESKGDPAQRGVNSYAFACAGCGATAWVDKRPAPEHTVWPKWKCGACKRLLSVRKATCLKCTVAVKDCRCGFADAGLGG